MVAVLSESGQVFARLGSRSHAGFKGLQHIRAVPFVDDVAERCEVVS